jgi:cell division protein FtsZ
MSGAGSALMGIGSARGDDRSVAAAEMAISSPLLEASIDGAHGVLLSIQGGSDLGLFEINEAAQLVSNSAAPEANIIFGAVIDDALGDEVRVTVIAAGFNEAGNSRAQLTRMSAAQPEAAPAAGPGGVAFHPSPFPAAEPVAGPGPLAGATAGGPAATAATGDTAAAGDAVNTSDAGGAVPREPAAAAKAMTATPTPVGSNGGPPSVPAASQAGDTNGGPSPRVAQEPGRPRPDTATAARVFESATTRRRSVVFEEDDELDVPDFLK